MPEPAPDRYQTYAGRTASDAAKALSKLPKESQLAWIRIQTQLLNDPVGLGGSRPMGSRNGKLFLFSSFNPPLEVTYEVDNEDGTVYFMHFSAPQWQEKSNKVLIVYSQKDKKWFDDLRKWISDLEDDGLIQTLDVSKIEPGATIRDEIEALLATARMALLLVSMDFLTKDFKSDQLGLPELLKARDDGEFSVQWIAVRPCINTHLLDYKALNDPKKPLSSLTVAAREVVFLAIHDTLQKIVEDW